MMNMLSRWPIVYVEWEDHAATASWLDESELDTTSALVSSIGWLCRETDEMMILVSSQDPPANKIGNTQYILKKLVKKVTYVRGGKRRKKNEGGIAVPQ